ncbi:MAG: hypothetical protein ACJ768_09315 [Gaiellaceae bacterium]
MALRGRSYSGWVELVLALVVAYSLGKGTAYRECRRDLERLERVFGLRFAYGGGRAPKVYPSSAAP